ncbi:tetratricopetide-repeat thioredoxin-like 3 [Striga asiatica]|uniref:Tetratricopetide-repeat thioredoxin-like 3 n=1 Tax=Striga asiatica TaxID=4170 RepID=A0A5A7RF07_STRAF|nr:tetratricopetide-repeat thioredoxin-like 3 [Striga asiatica]
MERIYKTRSSHLFSNTILVGFITFKPVIFVEWPESKSRPTSPAAHLLNILKSVVAFRLARPLPILITSQTTLSIPATAASSATTSDPPFRQRITNVAAALSRARSDPSLSSFASLSTTFRTAAASSGSTSITSPATSTAPASTSLPAPSRSPARFRIAIIASRLGPVGPVFARLSSASVAARTLRPRRRRPAPPVRLKMAAAAFPLASHVAPDLSTWITPSMAPSVSRIRALLESRMERLRMVVTAFIWRLGSSERRHLTRSGRVPASAMQRRLSESVLARTRSSWTRRSAAAGAAAAASLLTRNETVILVASRAALLITAPLGLTLTSVVSKGIRWSLHHIAIKFFNAKLGIRRVSSEIGHRKSAGKFTSEADFRRLRAVAEDARGVDAPYRTHFPYRTSPIRAIISTFERSSFWLCTSSSRFSISPLQLAVSLKFSLSKITPSFDWSGTTSLLMSSSIFSTSILRSSSHASAHAGEPLAEHCLLIKSSNSPTSSLNSISFAGKMSRSVDNSAVIC